VKGKQYLYFWKYVDENGRRKQIEKYMGPLHDPDARLRTVKAMETYYAEIEREIKRRLQEARAPLLGT